MTIPPRWVDWAIEVLLEVASRLGPKVRKHLDRLIVRLDDLRPLYEIKDYQAGLEVLDAKGKRAIYTKRERLRFLRNDVTSLYDYGWGTGEAFASHRVHPGRIVERQKIGSRHRSLVVLPQPKHAGDEMTLSVRRLWKNTLTGHNGWLEMEVYHPTRRARLSVTLPRSRPVRSARLVETRRRSSLPLQATTISDGRQRLQWSTTALQVGDRYTLEWDW